LEGKLGDDDFHDREYICDYVANSENNTNFPPRILIPEFRTLVELHEGQGLSFEEIAKRRVVLTYLDADAISDLYYKFRSEGCEDELATTLPWRPEEIDLLKQMCRTSRRLMNNLASFLDGRGDREIGDKLAEMWLARLAQTNTDPSSIVQHRSQSNASDVFGAVQHEEQRQSLLGSSLVEYTAGAGNASMSHISIQSVTNLFEDDVSIKDEPDSDEELFGRR
jgi:hypothetical protein